MVNAILKVVAARDNLYPMKQINDKLLLDVDGQILYLKHGLDESPVKTTRLGQMQGSEMSRVSQFRMN